MKFRGMKQSTINIILSSISLFLTILMIISVLVVNFSFKAQNIAENRRMELKDLCLQLSNTSDYLTDQARKYAQFGNPEYYDNYLKEINETKTRDNVIARLKLLNLPKGDLDLIEKANENYNALSNIEAQAIEVIGQKDFDKARHLLYDYSYESVKQEINKSIAEFQKNVNTKADNEVLKAQKALDISIKAMIILIVLLILSVFANVFVYTKSIIRPIKLLKDYMLNMSEGDLTKEVPLAANDSEIGQLVGAIKKTIRNISSILNTIKGSSLKLDLQASNLAAISEELSNTTQNMAAAIDESAKGTSTQSADLISITRVVDKFSEKLSNIVQDIKEVEDDSKGIDSMATDSKNKMDDLVESIHNIDKAFKDFAKEIDKLNIDINKINDISNFINSISEQTNLLALNAAIEAARAGEAGRGFAVVADEIRKLAEQSKVSSLNINSLIKNIAASSKMIITNSDSMSIEIDNQVTVVNNAILSFNNIIESVNRINPKVEEVNDELLKLSSDNNVILEKIEGAASIAQEISAFSEEVAASTEEMNSSSKEVSKTAQNLTLMTKEMTEEVGSFKI